MKIATSVFGTSWDGAASSSPARFAGGTVRRAGVVEEASASAWPVLTDAPLLRFPLCFVVLIP